MPQVCAWRSTPPISRESARARSTIPPRDGGSPGTDVQQGHPVPRRSLSRPRVSPAVAGAIAEGRLHPDVIVTRRVAWREAAQAIAEPAVKLVVEREAPY